MGLKANLAKIVCFGYKWSDEKETHCLVASDFPGWWKRGIGLSDKRLLSKGLEIMSEADLLVAHFGDKFDRRFFQGRIAIAGLTPPPPTKQRDTWKIARGAFAYSSNRLGDLAVTLGVTEQKHVKTRDEWPGWWEGVMAGGTERLALMAEYCKQDVRTLEAVYNTIRVYDNQQHPNLYTGRGRPVCGLCGGAVQMRGLAFVGRYRYGRFQCKKCGRWGRSNEREKDD